MSGHELLPGRVDRGLPECEGAEVAPIRVIIVDDHEIYRTGLRLLLEKEVDLTVLDDVGSADEALALIVEARPDVVVMDINMPGTGGVEATRQIREIDKDVAVVMLTMQEDEDSLRGALAAGANSYLSKSDSSELIMAAVRNATGSATFGKAVAPRVIQSVAAPRPSSILPELTDREREVLLLIAEGKNNAAIARQLFLSPKTVRNHISNIFHKLDVDTRAEAMIRAQRAGLTQQ